ncbi:MAG: hypothetical protein IPQ23_22320 [Cytophagaceae bacterium]|nr:hypothetical protein [Cytophagaceae bacterium]
MSAHTPGPWEVRKRGAAFSSDEIRPVKPFPGVIPLAWVAKLNDGDANAHLIAAAPDLLAVTRRWLRVMGNAGPRCLCSSRKGEEYVCCRCEIEAAIARAEGRQP